MVKACQITKLEKMKTCYMKIQGHYSLVEVIVNISRRQLTTTWKVIAKQRSQLSHNHQVDHLLISNSPNQVCSLKNSRGPGWWVKIENETSTREIKVSETKISKAERQAIKSLREDNSSIILPEDKGNATVVMDRVEYFNELVDLIGNGGNCKSKEEPDPEDGKEAVTDLGKYKDLIPQIKYRQLIQRYSKLPYIYGLPKIHKNGIPLRPIVSKRGSACHTLCRFLAEIISPLTGKSSL